MKRKSPIQLVALAACSTLALLGSERAVQAEGPETQSITFAVRFEATGLESSLADFLGPDTIALLIGSQTEVGDTTSFHSSSPPCDGIPVNGTNWEFAATAMVLNAGGPDSGRIYVLAEAPPTRYVLLVDDITDVHACWLNFDGTKYWAQDSITGAEAAFFIVTAKFRVAN